MDDVFIEGFVSHVRVNKGKEFYILGEYWAEDVGENNNFLDNVNDKSDLFDVGLHFNLYNVSKIGSEYDLRQIFDNTIVKILPLLTVTFVDNHDSQLGESLEYSIETWFKKIAYALILHRKEGYPCIFYVVLWRLLWNWWRKFSTWI